MTKPNLKRLAEVLYKPFSPESHFHMVMSFDVALTMFEHAGNEEMVKALESVPTEERGPIVVTEEGVDFLEAKANTKKGSNMEYDVIKLQARAGEDIHTYIRRCVATAEASGCQVEANFNDVSFAVCSSHFEQVKLAYVEAK